MPIIIVFFIIGIIFIILAKASVKNVPAHMKVLDIQKCIKILGRGYSKIDCAIYFINNQNDFNKYAINKISGFYSEYMTLCYLVTSNMVSIPLLSLKYVQLSVYILFLHYQLK
ncbi:hypothetical protein [Clostridium estertheticum]|uniref:hypothetical protein n=1 Tax=Clostridium estertheticum TaxID=238834 RepID=UPI001C0B00FB|nr:hypothetical protein [Clostridium estertheticum]MBU3075694.1 hypothetical protein [Clostridium estertheticum]MBU3165806.1 hypothetical protein [Clostridium estertheticum]